uniref:Uncharacterized protein n=1 Tax=Arundo donax TaxID=35708 RepID=A0A0A9EEL9_ARUDO
MCSNMSVIRMAPVVQLCLLSVDVCSFFTWSLIH